MSIKRAMWHYKKFDNIIEMIDWLNEVEMCSEQVVSVDFINIVVVYKTLRGDFSNIIHINGYY